MQTFIDETIMFVALERFRNQKRFTTIPDYITYLVSMALDKMRKDEFDMEMARAEYELRKKKK